MSATDIFRCKDAMPRENENAVQPMMISATSSYARLPGEVKFPNDVRPAREYPNSPTGRRP